jgi:hypothetical protein
MNSVGSDSRGRLSSGSEGRISNSENGVCRADRTALGWAVDSGASKTSFDLVGRIDETHLGLLSRGGDLEEPSRL